MTSDNDDKSGTAEAGIKAAAIIARFGGIRPMAARIDIPVTTVQGWKKRDTIPFNRIDQIRSAARQHGLSLEGLDTPLPRVPGFSTDTPDRMAAARAAPAMPDVVYKDFTHKVSRAERQAIGKSAIINIALIAVTLGSVLLLVWPQAQKQSRQNRERIQALEHEIAALEDKIMAVRNQAQPPAPGPLDSAALGRTAAETAVQATAQIGATAQQALGDAAARAEQLGVHIPSLPPEVGATATALTGFMGRLQILAQSPEGTALMQGAWSTIAQTLATTPDASFEQILAVQIEAQNEPAAQSAAGLPALFENIPPEQVKAAVILLGMTQLRNTLARENAPFARDLAIVKRLIGNDDPELAAALDALAPQAERGILSPTGLSRELRGMTGEIVAAALSGEDISIQDRAAARLGTVLSIEKNGEALTGTPAQKHITRAQSLIDQGDLAGAIDEMRTLQGPAGQSAASWVRQAETTLRAGQVQGLLTNSINARTLGESALSTVNGLVGGTVVQDARSGINIYRPGLDIRLPGSHANPYYR